MRLNYREYGQGEPVIILHGLLGMLDNWHSFSKTLSEKYWIISVDQRNHGRSFHSSDIDYPLMAEDLLEFMDELHIPKCHILGHSMGGKTSMQFINDYPDRIDKAIIVDIAPKAYKGGHEHILNALRKIKINEVKDRQEVQDQLMKELNDQGTVLFLMKNLTRNKNSSYEWKANIKSLQSNYHNITAALNLSGPLDTNIAFIRGGLSEYIKDEDFVPIKSIFPNSEFHTVEDAGHWVHADDMQTLLEIVENFLS